MTTSNELIDRSIDKIHAEIIASNSNRSWAHNHLYAWQLEKHPIVGMIKAWAKYADEHEKQYGQPIGKDYFLGQRYWKEMGEALRGLLNGDLGQLDGGILDGLILDIMDNVGIDTNDL